jgi:hypothetical protein
MNLKEKNIHSEPYAHLYYYSKLINISIKNKYSSFFLKKYKVCPSFTLPLTNLLLKVENLADRIPAESLNHVFIFFKITKRADEKWTTPLPSKAEFQGYLSPIKLPRGSL